MWVSFWCQQESGKSKPLSSNHWAPGPVLCALYSLTHLILTSAPRGLLFCLHFRDGETEALEVNSPPKDVKGI